MVESVNDLETARALRRHRRQVLGQVYVAEAVGLRRVKIGFSTNAVKRLKSVAIICPVPLRVVVLIDAPPSREREIHRELRHAWCHGEWFELERHVETFIARHRLEEPMLIYGSKSASYLGEVHEKPLPRRYRWKAEHHV